MAKLGYTFYPKDWGNSEAVFELNLSERGLYRELIDLAMSNDNKTEIKIDLWSRKFGASHLELTDILEKLAKLNLVKIDGSILFIPSCENRLKLVRGGKKGGETSKPTAEHIVNPSLKPEVKPLEKPTLKPEVNQIEREKETKKKPKGKEDKVFIPPTFLEVEDYFHENGFSKESAKRAFEYYNCADWIDSKDNQVKNWKQKMNSVWFKEENKIKPIIAGSPKVNMASPIL